eukprot:239469-Amphidinium_carterae.3
MVRSELVVKVVLDVENAGVLLDVVRDIHVLLVEREDRAACVAVVESVVYLHVVECEDNDRGQQDEALVDAMKGLSPKSSQWHACSFFLEGPGFDEGGGVACNEVARPTFALATCTRVSNVATPPPVVQACASN